MRSSHHNLHNPSAFHPPVKTLYFLTTTYNMSTRDQNPSLETPPDFRTPGYTLIHQALIAQDQGNGNNLDDNSAAKQLLDAWEEERWTRQATWDKATAEEERERTALEAECQRAYFMVPF